MFYFVYAIIEVIVKKVIMQNAQMKNVYKNFTFWWVTVS